MPPGEIIMLYFIGLKLPYDLKEEVKRLHKLLNVGSHSTAPPHITLVPSFVLEEDEDYLIHDLEDLFTKTKEFSVQIRGLGSFRNAKDRNVIHMDVIDTPELLNLRDKLCDILKSKVRNELIVRRSDLHITISKKLTVEELNYSIETLKDYYIERKFTVSEVYLFKIENNKPWEEYKIFKLKNSKKPYKSKKHIQ